MRSGVVISVRFMPSELERISAAMQQGDLWGRQTRSEFIREAALGSADKVLLQLRAAKEAKRPRRRKGRRAA